MGKSKGPAPHDLADIIEIGVYSTAIHYDVDPKVVYRWLREANVVKPKAHVFSDNDVSYLRANCQTKSISQMAEILGFSKSTIGANLRKHGIVWPKFKTSNNVSRFGPRAITNRIKTKSIDAVAAEHIAITDRVPVMRCDEQMNITPDGKYWLYGYGNSSLSRTRTADEIMAMAARKGWQQDAWRAVA